MKLVKNIIFVCSLIFSLACLVLFGPKILNKLQLKSQTEFENQFVSPIIANPALLKYPPVKNNEELNHRINKLIVDIDSIEFAYENIKIESFEKKEKILEIRYTYKGKKDTVFAFLKTALKQLSNTVGVLVIPGSGINQSTEIYNKNNTGQNYQSNIDDIYNYYGDVFILVKPNEDFLAIHNGEKKIAESSYVNYLINVGSSYSAYYFIQSLALSKYIKNKYEMMYITGLSQGGYVALLNSLQSNPQKSVIASGYSILLDNPHQSGHNQFILPGLSNFFNKEKIKNNIMSSNTDYLFTYGKQEYGIYGREANEFLTKDYYSELENVTVNSHKGKHVYDSISTVRFLNKIKQ